MKTFTHRRTLVENIRKKARYRRLTRTTRNRILSNAPATISNQVRLTNDEVNNQIGISGVSDTLVSLKVEKSGDIEFIIS